MEVDAFSGSGYEWIGMDHYARPTDDLALAAREPRLHRDFMGYTTRPGPHLPAFGMSAIGDVAGHYVQTVPRTGEYQRFSMMRSFRSSEAMRLQPFLRNIAMALHAYLPQQLAEARPVLSRTV
jgi:coproporphyrinogen III oxidase-like Fe-S oxidoreductase